MSCTSRGHLIEVPGGMEYMVWDTTGSSMFIHVHVPLGPYIQNLEVCLTKSLSSKKYSRWSIPGAILH